MEPKINIIQSLQDNKLTIATSESCTGGLVCGEFTSYAGSSAVVLGGVIAYSNEAKVKILNVDPESLDKYGAVSEQTAKEMAEGVRALLGSSIGISTTGIAGPGGGTKQKPVGTVFVAICQEEKCDVHHLELSGDRNQIRQKTVDFVMEKINELIS